MSETNHHLDGEEAQSARDSMDREEMYVKNVVTTTSEHPISARQKKK